MIIFKELLLPAPTQSRVRLQVSAAVLERRQWRKFGASEKLKPGDSDPGVTAQSVEEIFLERGEHFLTRPRSSISSESHSLRSFPGLRYIRYG